MKDEHNYLYFNVTEIKWPTPIVIAESKWKRKSEEVRALFKMYRKKHYRDPEMDRLFYNSGRQGICTRPAKHVGANNQSRRMVQVPYDPYQRVMKAQTVKMEGQKPMIKLVSYIAGATDAQATEMALSEIKREHGREESN